MEPDGRKARPEAALPAGTSGQAPGSFGASRMSDASHQRSQFNALISAGIYSSGLDHGSFAERFVRDCVLEAVGGRSPDQGLDILECGCGTGIWLRRIHDLLTDQGLSRFRLAGFDISDGMIDIARNELKGIAAAEDIRRGDLNDPDAFTFKGAAEGFDLILAYDVIQQLPRREQFRACVAIADHLKPGGTALIFDNDSSSGFGRRMAVRKFLTRYLYLPLVPRYFCSAAYPPLARFRDRLLERTPVQATISIRSDGIKRALALRAPAAGAHA